MTSRARPKSGPPPLPSTIPPRRSDVAPRRAIPPPLPPRVSTRPEPFGHPHRGSFVSEDDIVGGRIHVLYERLAHDDYEGALLVAQRLLAREPDNRDAQQCRDMCVTELTKLYVSRLGALDRVPQLSVEAEDIRPTVIGVSAGRVLRHVDGLRTVEAIVDGSRLPRVEALRRLSEAYLEELIEFADE